ncbi:hypothetical protein D3C74_440420 [compost metagenome]
MIPLWAEKMHKTEFRAFQASQRTGELYCRMEQDHVMIAGKAALYSVADIFLPENV